MLYTSALEGDIPRNLRRLVQHSTLTCGSALKSSVERFEFFYCEHCEFGRLIFPA